MSASIHFEYKVSAHVRRFVVELAQFHRIIAAARSVRSLTEREFLGILADTAHRSEKTVRYRTPEERKHYYQKLMSNIYNTSADRTPLPALKSRAILYQREECFDDVLEYMRRNISDCEAVVREIIRMDDLQRNGKDFLTAVNEFEVENNPSKRYLSESEKKRACAAYLAEYYYYTVLWNLLLSALPDLEELPAGISHAFPCDDQFHHQLIEAYYLDEAYQKHADQMLTANGQAIVRIDRFLISGEYNSPENNKRNFLLPVKWKKDTIRAALLLDEYSFFLTDNRILVYTKKTDGEKIFRIIQIPKQKKQAMNPKFLAFEFVPSANQVESKGTLLALSTQFYLELIPERISWDFTDLQSNGKEINKINKIGKIPDYTLHPIDLIDVNRLSGKVRLHNGCAEYDTFSDDHIERHQLRLGIDEHASSETLFTLEGLFRNGDTSVGEASPNGQYILLITNDHLAVLLDKKDTTRSLILCESAKVTGISYADMIQQATNPIELTAWGFSQDSRFFAFTINKADSVTTEVVNLRTMEKQKLELGRNDQCRFVDFYEDRVLIEWVDDEPGVGYCWYDLSRSSWILN